MRSRSKRKSSDLPRIRAVSVFKDGGYENKWSIGIFDALFDPSAYPEPGYRWGAVERFGPYYPYGMATAPWQLVQEARSLAGGTGFPFVEGLYLGSHAGLSPLEILSRMHDVDS